MNHKKNILACLLFLSLTLSFAQSGGSENASTSDQPNIVVFLCDDLGYGDLGSYGHPHIETPNIDKLAETGVKLSHFYAAAPVCSPSRAGLLTGRSPNRAGIYDFILGGNRKRDDNRDMVHLRQEETTIPQRLKSVGYSTCLVGKWHCSSLFNSEDQPKPDELGFDHWFATHNNAVPSHENPRNFVRNGEKVGEIEGFSCQIIVDEAMSWLDKQEKDKPFFLEVAFHEPHVPIESPRSLVEKYLPVSRSENEAQFFANVENVDIAVGRLVEYLEKNDLDNTIIVFTSDNGAEALYRYNKAQRSYGSPGPLYGMKLWTNEGGIRVPCVINWKGKLKVSGDSDAVVSALDFMPTFCEVAGAALPDRELDGQSLTNFFETGEIVRDKPLLWCFYNAMNVQVLAMREGDWKIMARLQNEETLPKIYNLYDGNETYVKESELTGFSLYNLVEDVEESKNLIKDKPQKFEEMKQKLESEYQDLLEGSHIWSRDQQNVKR